MEYQDVVTQIKSAERTKKSKVITPKSASVREKPMVPKLRKSRKPVLSESRATDAAYTEVPYPQMPDVAPNGASKSTPNGPSAKRQRPGIGHLASLGKDLISGDPASVAAAAAIIVGAALIEIELIPGLVIGAGAILMSKFLPEMSSYVRPAIKGAVRTGFVMTQKVREVFAESSEQVQDLVAEVMMEQQNRHHAAGPVPEPASGSVPKV